MIDKKWYLIKGIVQQQQLQLHYDGQLLKQMIGSVGECVVVMVVVVIVGC